MEYFDRYGTVYIVSMFKTLHLDLIGLQIHLRSNKNGQQQFEKQRITTMDVVLISFVYK